MPLYLIILLTYLSTGVVSWLLVIRYFPPTPRVPSETGVLPVHEEKKPAFSGVLYSALGVCTMIVVSPLVLVIGLIAKSRNSGDE